MTVTTSWNPETYARNARFVSDLGEPLLELLAAKPGETIFDLGCGDGALTMKIARAGCAVYAADASFLQARAAMRRGVRAVVMDGRQMALKCIFDAVFTNAALHWIRPPEQVLQEVARCLKPGGRFIGEFGGQGNIATIRAALHTGLGRRGIDPSTIDPWYYPAPEDYEALLAKFAFTVISMELIPRPTELPADMRDWLGIFAQPFTRAVAESERESFVDEVRAALAPALRKADGRWFADYVRLRFKAVRRQ
jgi:SAM-dependent methyltransferase